MKRKRATDLQRLNNKIKKSPEYSKVQRSSFLDTSRNTQNMNFNSSLDKERYFLKLSKLSKNDHSSYLNNTILKNRDSFSQSKNISLKLFEELDLKNILKNFNQKKKKSLKINKINKIQTINNIIVNQKK